MRGNKAPRANKHPDGMPAISRGLRSAATTPPDTFAEMAFGRPRRFAYLISSNSVNPKRRPL
jgi:hypothetical protein